MKNNWLVEKINFIWRKKYLWLFTVIALLGSCLLGQFFKANLNDLLLFNTLIAILWYSRETMDLKQISNKQVYHLRKEHKTNLRPYLRLQKKTGENVLQLVNEGKGVAVNLRSVYKKDGHEVQLPGITAMASAPNSFTEGLTPARLGINFDSDENCQIEINYNDVESRNYHAVFKRNADYNDRFEIVEQKEIKFGD